MCVSVHGRIGGGITIRLWHITIVRFVDYAHFCHLTQQKHQLVYNFDLNCSVGLLHICYCCCCCFSAYCWPTTWPNLHCVMDTARHSATQYAVVCMYVCLFDCFFACVRVSMGNNKPSPLGFKSSPYQQMIARKKCKLK